MLSTIATRVLLTFLVLTGTAATAEETANLSKGRWLLRAGVYSIRPTASTDLNPGTIEFQPADSLAGSVTYFLAPHWGLELWLGAPVEHDIEYSGMTVASADYLPATVSLRFRFRPTAAIRPYAAAGVNLTEFSGENLRPETGGGNLKLERSFGLALEAGVDYDIADHWSVNAELRWWDSDTDGYLNGASVGNFHIDPIGLGLNVGYHF